MPVRNLPAGREQIRLKQPRDKIQLHDFMPQRKARRLRRRKRQLARIMFGPVIETDDGGHDMVDLRPMERGHRIHPAGT